MFASNFHVQFNRAQEKEAKGTYGLELPKEKSLSIAPALLLFPNNWKQATTLKRL